MPKQAGEAKLLNAGVFNYGSCLAKPGLVGTLITCLIAAELDRHTGARAHLRPCMRGRARTCVCNHDKSLFTSTTSRVFSAKPNCRALEALVATHPRHSLWLGGGLRLCRRTQRAEVGARYLHRVPFASSCKKINNPVCQAERLQQQKSLRLNVVTRDGAVRPAGSELVSRAERPPTGAETFNHHGPVPVEHFVLPWKVEHESSKV